MSQMWIKSGTTYLAAVSNECLHTKEKQAVLLLPGFMQPKCDIYYFLTIIREQLKLNDYYAIQVDLEGHGDSYTRIEDVTYEMLKNNVINVIDYLDKQGFKECYAIARGYSGNLLLKIIREECRLSKVIALNPIIMDRTERNALVEKISSFADDDGYVCFKENTLKTLYYSLKMFGTTSSNIAETKVKASLLLDIVKESEVVCHDNMKSEKVDVVITNDWRFYYDSSKADVDQFVKQNIKLYNFNERIKLCNYFVSFLNSDKEVVI